MKQFEGKVAVITGAGSGFGLEFARIAAARKMKLVLADVQQDALDRTQDELKAAGAQVIAQRCDVASSDQVQALSDACMAAFGAPHLVFNNAGVGGGGLIWESTLKDWEWVIGVNVFGVAHGVRIFTPLMLNAAQADPSYEGHIVNTASMAGMLNAPNMGVYNVSKHAVVSLSETLYQDLSLVTDQISCSVLCPYFVPTGIAHSHRNRPQDLRNDAKATKSQLIAQAMSDRAVSSGKLTAQQVAQLTYDAVERSQFYIFSHPQAAVAGVTMRMQDIAQQRNPSDPFADSPHIRQALLEQLRA